MGGAAADKKHLQKKAAELDSFDDADYNEDSASLKSMFGLGPKDLPDAADVDPVLVATGMDSSAGVHGSSSDYDSSSDSPVGIAIVDSKRSKKHHKDSDADLSSYDRHHSSSSSSSSEGSAATSQELMQAFDALDENDKQQKQHHKQQHKQNRLGWVLGRRSAKGRDSHRDAELKADKDSSSGSSGSSGSSASSSSGAGGSNVAAAFVDRRIKPLLAAIKSRAPNLVGRGRNRKYTRAEVEEIVKIMSTELKAKQGQHSSAGSSSSSSSSGDFDSASSNGYVVLSESPATTTSSSDDVTFSDDSSSSSSDVYDQESVEAYDDAYAEQKFKELVQELHHHKKGAAATDTYTDDTTHSSHSHAHTHPHAHAHAHKSHGHSGATDTDSSTDKHSVGKGTVYDGLLYSELKDAKHQKHKHDSSAYADAGADSSPAHSDAHKAVKKAPHGTPSAYSDAKKATLKARKTVHGTTHANPATGVINKDGVVAKPKHKKLHSTTATPSAAAKRAAHTHKASHAKRAQFLDSSEMEDIKTILEAIYDKENNGIAAEVTGEEAATLDEIQAALQPHIITDDPESFALSFTTDSSTEDSIPSEQPAAPVPAAAAPAQEQPAPTPAELPQKPAAAPAAAPAPAAQKAPASDKKASAPTPANKKPSAAKSAAPAAPAVPAPAKKATPAPTPAASPADKAAATSTDSEADDGTEVVYEIEYVETEDDDVDGSTVSADDADTEFEYVEVEETVEGSIEGDVPEGTEVSEANMQQSKPASDANSDSSKKFRASDKSASSKSSNSAKASSAKGATDAHTPAADSKTKATTKPSNDDKIEGKSSTKESPKGAGEAKEQKEPRAKAASPASSSSSSSPKSAVDKAQSAESKPSSSSKAAAAPKSSSSSSSSKKAASRVQEQEEEVAEVEEEAASEAPAKPAKDSKPASKAQQPKTSAPAAAPAAPAPAAKKQTKAQFSPFKTQAAAVEEEEQEEKEEEREEVRAKGKSAKAKQQQKQQQQPDASVINCTANPETTIHNCAVCAPSEQGTKLECQYCNAGYYREGPNKCTLCPKGAFCGGNERVDCKEGYTTEEAGSWSERQCKVCAAGFGAANAPGGLLNCQRCPVGTFNTHGQNLPCQQCPPMTMSIDMVSTGRFGDSGTTCLACPTGLVPDDSNTDCRCPASNSNCACPKGWVSIAGTGMPPCVKCGAGNTYAAIKKGTSIKACVACPRDSMATDGTDCVCRPGTFSKDGTAFVPGGCVPCPADSTSASSGSTKCLRCAPNTVPNAARTECVQRQQ